MQYGSVVAAILVYQQLSAWQIRDISVERLHSLHILFHRAHLCIIKLWDPRLQTPLYRLWSKIYSACSLSVLIHVWVRCVINSIGNNTELTDQMD